MPYLDGPELEIRTIGGDTIHFYWLVPITAAEKAYKARHGLLALEARFGEGALDYVNPARPSMV